MIALQNILIPTKEDVRNWLVARTSTKNPLPEREEIRRQLGWDIVRKTVGNDDLFASVAVNK